MTAILRNPDVALHDGGKIPADCYLHVGSRLMLTARAAGVPFGICTDRVYFGTNKHKSRIVTIGLIITYADRDKFHEHLAKKK